MRLAIEKAIDSVRPMLQADGGDITFLDYFNRIVYVRLLGACEGCPHATVTIKEGVEARLLEEFPGDVLEVRDMTMENAGL